MGDGRVGMIKIGNMAKICGVNTQTLRYYDAEGVLRPEATDKNTGYRLYSPSDIEKFRKIQFYKSLGFELSEIKELLNKDGADFRKIMIKRKNAVLSDVASDREKIRKIDELTRDPDSINYYSMFDSMPFSDDPGVVGKWELCGELHDKNDPSKVDPDVSVFAHKEIPFLPGGAYVWIWFWTKGVLYRILANGGIVVPNPYRIVDKNGEKYMIIEYIGDDCIDDGGDPVYLLYKQTDTTPYTDKTIRKRIDNTDIPYVDDPDVLGAWEAVDFVKTANDFDIKKPKSDKKDLWLMYIRFLPRGICVKTVKTDRAPADIVLRYTKDFVLCDSELTAEKYVIKNTDGADHLFLQHKSGDYSYGGLEPLLYVFKRKEVKHE